MKGDDMDQMEGCEHTSWSLVLDDSVDPAEADGVPVCDFCQERLDEMERKVLWGRPNPLPLKRSVGHE